MQGGKPVWYGHDRVESDRHAEELGGGGGGERTNADLALTQGQ